MSPAPIVDQALKVVPGCSGNAMLFVKKNPRIAAGDDGRPPTTGYLLITTTEVVWCVHY